MYVGFQGDRYNGPCNVVSNKKMHCLSPRIRKKVHWRSRDNPQPMRLDYGFIMDDVSRVQNLSDVLNSHLLLYPDPRLVP